jgi:hypothetical protein
MDDLWLGRSAFLCRLGWFRHRFPFHLWAKAKLRKTKDTLLIGISLVVLRL